MTPREILRELDALGTAQNRKVYARHGVRRAMSGVSFANLAALRKKYREHADLAEPLWRSGNHDARILATMLADPATVSSSTLDAWARELDSYVIADALAQLVARTPHAMAKARKWTRARAEFVGQAGWDLVTLLAARPDEASDEWLAENLATIEAEVHGRPNRVRHAMNMALIGIALRGGALERQAIAAARRIGPIEVDHGETGCVTPDPIRYIARAKARRKGKGGGTGKGGAKARAKGKGGGT